MPPPKEAVIDYLGEDEHVIHDDHPSFRAFLIKQIVLAAAIVVSGPILVLLAGDGIDWTVLLLFSGLLVVVLYMAVRRVQDRYVSYVITNLRLMRVSGVFQPLVTSIPWTRMTGLGYFQSIVGRVLGFATIFIESADEASGLRSISDMNDPATFHRRLLEMVSSRRAKSPEANRHLTENGRSSEPREDRYLGETSEPTDPWPRGDDGW